MKKDYNLIFAKGVLIALLITVLCAFAATCYKYYDISFNNNILTRNDEASILDVFGETHESMTYAPGLSIDSIDISNLTLDQAREIISTASAPRLSKITVVNGEKSVDIDLSSLEGTKNTEELLRQAISLGNVGTRGERKAERQSIQEKGMAIKTSIDYDVAPIHDQIRAAAKELCYEPTDPTVKVKENFNPQASSADEIFEFVEGNEGSKVDGEMLIKEIQNAINEGKDLETLTATASPVAVKSKADDLKGKFSLISTYTSSFAQGSNGEANRVKNIKKAADIITGHIIQPGENFSFNTVVGPRNGSGGWFLAGAISEGQSVKEYGGGICQVSSTLFNAVKAADLEIVDRRPHSWPLSYIPAGQDATVSTGGPDFVFRNSRSTPVVAISRVDENKKTLTFELYGEPVADGMEIRLTSKKVGSISEPKAQIIKKSSMKPGSRNTIRRGRAGQKYETYKEYYKDGVLVKKELDYTSTYRAIAAIVEVGPAGSSSRAASAPAAPAQAAEPVPAPAAPAPVDDIIDIPEE